MKTAVLDGDVKELAELMSQDPGFDVNMDQYGLGLAILHHACDGSDSSHVIPLLLAHPDIDVNVKTKSDRLPFIGLATGTPPVFVRC